MSCRRRRRAARAFRDGLVTSLANPKLAVFFVALFPQFVGERGDVLPTTLRDGGDDRLLRLHLVHALAVLGEPRQGRRSCAAAPAAGCERVTGSVLIALGLRVALSGRHAGL